MKRLALSVFILLGSSARGEESPLDVGGISKLIADKAKEAKLATMLDLSGIFGGALYLPVWTLKGAGDSGAEYISLGAGGMIREGGGKLPLAGIAFNLPALSAKLWSFQWAKDHVKRAKFPPIWAGPYVLIPTSKSYVIGSNAGVMISIGL